MDIIESEISEYDFGATHNEAKNSCCLFKNLIDQIHIVLKDPYNFTYETINELKRITELKRETLKLRIDEEIEKVFDKLDDYEQQCKEYLYSNEFKYESDKIESKLRNSQNELDSWNTILNKMKFDQEKLKTVNNECCERFIELNNDFDMLKNQSLLNKFDEINNYVDYIKEINIEPLFNINGFSDSVLLNDFDLFIKFDLLLKRKQLNNQKWTLLYRGSRDGLRASEFHSRCDHKPNTLSIIKVASGNIFGGYASEQWTSKADNRHDPNAFVFSLVNKENRELIFERNTLEQFSQSSIRSHSSSGPIFGGGDMVIRDSPHGGLCGYSSLGWAYIHPDYPHESERTLNILAGSFNFCVEEIEVFQKQKQ